MNRTLIIGEAENTLKLLANCIQELNNHEYTKQIPILSDSTIGEHSRHIIELFQQLLKGYETGTVNYDDRNRDILLQENIDFAIESISQIAKGLDRGDKELEIVSLYNNAETPIKSNYLRELLYNIEHCIHHQAIIKIGLSAIKKMELNENFGIAKSTIEYRKQCVQ